MLEVQLHSRTCKSYQNDRTEKMLSLGHIDAQRSQTQQVSHHKLLFIALFLAWLVGIDILLNMIAQRLSFANCHCSSSVFQILYFFQVLRRIGRPC